MDGDLVYIKELSSVGSGAAVLTFTILLPSKKETHQKGRERIRITVWWKDEEQARLIQDEKIKRKGA